MNFVDLLIFVNNKKGEKYGGNILKFKQGTIFF